MDRAVGGRGVARSGSAAAPLSRADLMPDAVRCNRQKLFDSGGHMEPLIGIGCSTMECTLPSPNAPIWQDILAQAMTGELIAAMNYTSLSEICDDPHEVADALEHAEIEQGHAARFAREGRKIGVD